MKQLFLLVTLLLAGATTALAQPLSGVGLRLGGSAALLRGDNVGVTDDSTDRSLGFSASVYKAFSLGGGLALQPELVYTQKGGKLDLDEVFGEEMGACHVRFDVDYIEVPVAFELEDGSFSADGDDTFKTVDYGAIIGADLGFKLRRQTATVGLRYDVGVADIVKDDADADEEFATVGNVRNDKCPGGRPLLTSILSRGGPVPLTTEAGAITGLRFSLLPQRTPFPTHDGAGLLHTPMAHRGLLHFALTQRPQHIPLPKLNTSNITRGTPWDAL